MSDAGDRVVMTGEQLSRTVTRMAHEILEKNTGDERLAIVGIHTRGAFLARRLHAILRDIAGREVPLGELDISFYRDDVAARGAYGVVPSTPNPIVKSTDLDFAVDGATVVLVDDVLYTGRTIRAAIDALFDYGRPGRVQLAVLVDRGHRELPDQARLHRQEPADRPARAHRGVPGRGRRQRRGRAGQPGRGGVTMAKRDLLSIDDLTRAEAELILETAESFLPVLQRDIKKVPTLRGRTIINMFYESSTRTLTSFELAAKRLSADTMNVRAAGSAVDKGESLKDTILTLSAYQPDIIVMRHPQIGACRLASRYTQASVINAGDGKFQHPSQCLLDLFTMRQALGRELDGKKVWIVGDILHSRVARSDIAGFQLLGMDVTVAGPPSLIPRDVESLGVAVEYSLDRLPEADVIYLLRMQMERMQEGANFIPSLREYSTLYGMTLERLRPGQKVMHPGPSTAVSRSVPRSPTTPIH